MLVQAGLQEKYLVRVVEDKYVSDQGSIGRPKPDGGANYWTTTYTQIEHADSDAKLINQALGIDHDPSKSYTLLIIDNEKATATGQMKSFIPTYDSLGTLAKSAKNNLKPLLKH